MNTLAGGVASVINLAITVALVPFHIDRLGDAAYGVWVLVLSFSLSGGYLSLADLGLQHSLVKFVAGATGSSGQRRREIDLYVRSARRAFLVLGVLASVALAGLAFVAPRLFVVPAALEMPLRLLLLILAAEALVGIPALAALGLLEGLQRYTFIRAVEVARQVVFAVATVAVLLAGGGLVSFGLAAIASAIVGHLLFVAGAHKLWGSVAREGLEREAFRKLRSYGSWLFVSKVSGTVWRQMDKTILSVLVSTTVLTVYDVANKIQGAAATILSFTSRALIPATAQLDAVDDVRRLRELLLDGTRYTMALSLPTVTAAMVLAPELLRAWVGSGLVEATLAARMFLGYQLYVSAATVMLSMLVGLGYARVTARYSVAALILNLLLSLLLAPRAGVEGVVFATLVGYGISTTLYLRFGLANMGIPWKEFLHRTVVPLLPWTLALGLLTHVVRILAHPETLIGVFLTGVPGGITYALGVMLLVFGAEERQRVWGYVKKVG